MTRMIDIQVPDIGDVADVPVVEIAVSVGDEVAADDTLLVVETDKATLDIPSPEGGRIAALKVVPGDRVSRGTLIAVMEVSSAAAEALPEPPEAEAKPETPKPISTQPEGSRPVVASLQTEAAAMPTGLGKQSHATPSTRKFARSLGVDVASVPGTGPKGRILREDVERYVKMRMQNVATGQTGAGNLPLSELPEWPRVDFARFGPVERQPLSRIARFSGPALARNSLVIPHVCNFDKADVTELEQFRKELNAEAGSTDAKITMLAFTVKAVVAALKAFPRFNASLDGDELVVKSYWNIGVAADTPDGLVVPVVKQADQKGLRDVAAEMSELAGAARVGKLKPADMQGATFTISSLGGVGGTGFTPIINAPEVAILGMTRAEIQPVWDGESFRPRLVQPLSLSWDHRVVDGVLAARFLAHVSRSLGDFRRLSV
ncbi:dihydrolipoyllysine-residue acetyltransferase component of pyruvate dehydrogenase complex [Antarctobacter heliothermus]|uniref:Dihydrolipoamide acetyltransferase component of pyruvate dehydrogenase complex n=1 Tax=Antarctobacter heliothermus TaxID=74033 RepID=A0A222E4S5_9RHOB|nr:2-oxo acid dehydrogenase subunit E2 [Antarctobacter heliothermus]ASP20988.1 dihydrolipoyllysine-residue acetyltransferase component of pyruvate dehydrogenase complex [Antarctobacter heliothermus]